MQKRELGRTGLLVSPISIGCAPFGYVNRANAWDPYSDEGKKLARQTLNLALDAGINLVDTAPAYGDGHAETLVGEVMRHRRAECVLASKVRYGFSYQQVIDSVEASLKRLQSDHIDIMQIHGRMFSQSEQDHVIHNGPLDALLELQTAGKIGHIGITADEAWTLIPFLQYPEISVYQIAYNLIYQAAARHFLIEAEKVNAGVVTMRTMTSGVFQREMALLAPKWHDAHDLYEICLKFVLSDSRVHSGIIGMRWPNEVALNTNLLAGWEPPLDIAKMPRLTTEVYQAEDQDHSTI